MSKRDVTDKTEDIRLVDAYGNPIEQPHCFGQFNIPANVRVVNWKNFTPQHVDWMDAAIIRGRNGKDRT